MNVNQSNAILLLNKALYNLKQTPGLWYLLLYEVIIDMKYQVLEIDISIYIHDDIILVVYIDDILIIDLFIQIYNIIIIDFSCKFEVINKNEIKSFLNFNIIRNYEKYIIIINQSNYIN